MTRRKKTPQYLEEPKHRKLNPRNEAQKEFIECVNENIVTFCCGPAGTGKTFLSIGCAVEDFYAGKIDKIVVTRPTIECGSKLGFLPGSDQEKMGPFVRPVMEAYSKLIPKEMMKRPPIEVIPMQYMQGLTFDKTFIILDEAENCEDKELKMILTRLGDGSKIVLNGDCTQSVLPEFAQGAFDTYCDKFDGTVDHIAVFEFLEEDIVRNPLIKKILEVLR